MYPRVEGRDHSVLPWRGLADENFADGDGCQSFGIAVGNDSRVVADSCSARRVTSLTLWSTHGDAKLRGLLAAESCTDLINLVI